MYSSDVWWVSAEAIMVADVSSCFAAHANNSNKLSWSNYNTINNLPEIWWVFELGQQNSGLTFLTREQLFLLYTELYLFRWQGFGSLSSPHCLCYVVIIMQIAIAWIKELQVFISFGDECFCLRGASLQLMVCINGSELPVTHVGMQKYLEFWCTKGYFSTSLLSSTTFTFMYMTYSIFPTSSSSNQ